MHKIQINVLILQLRNLSVLSLLTKQIGSGPVTYAKNKQKILIYTKIKQNKENRPSCVVQRTAGRIRLVTQPQLDLPGFMSGFSSGTRCKPHKTTVSQLEYLLNHNVSVHPTFIGCIFLPDTFLVLKNVTQRFWSQIIWDQTNEHLAHVSVVS